MSAAGCTHDPRFPSGEAEFQENSKKKIELIGVQRRIKTKMPCAKARRIESAER